MNAEAAVLISQEAVTPLLVSPYLELAYTRSAGLRGEVNLLIHWHSRERHQRLEVLAKKFRSDVEVTVVRRIQLSDTDHFRHTAFLINLKSGTEFRYRIVDHYGRSIFEATAHVPNLDCPRIAFVPGCGDGSPISRETAHALYEVNPDLIVLGGSSFTPEASVFDLSETFFQVLNNEDRQIGAPVLRTIPVVGGMHPLFFDHDVVRSLSVRDSVSGRFESAESCAKFLGTIDSGQLPPANFALELGPVLILLLDGSRQCDWMKADALEWVEDTLKKSQAPWKCVFVHQPSSSDDPIVWGEQHPLFEIFAQYGALGIFRFVPDLSERMFTSMPCASPGCPFSFLTFENSCCDYALISQDGSGADVRTLHLQNQVSLTA